MYVSSSILRAFLDSWRCSRSTPASVYVKIFGIGRVFSCLSCVLSCGLLLITIAVRAFRFSMPDFDTLSDVVDENGYGFPKAVLYNGVLMADINGYAFSFCHIFLTFAYKLGNFMNKSQTALYPPQALPLLKKEPEINVYSSIIVGCQTKEKSPVCEDCFARHTCKLYVEPKPR